MASSRKKVIVRRFSAGLLWGYLPAEGVAQAGSPPVLDLLDLGGRVTPVPLAEVKFVSYVRDFNTADMDNPERMLRKSFLARPRAEGLWIRLGFRDGDRIEGLATPDITFADGLIEDGGMYLIPPDIRGNTQRLFVPRSAVDTLEVLAVVTNPSKKKLARPVSSDEAQPDLFTMPIPPGSRTQ